MNKMTKITLITAGVLAGLGLVFCITAIAIGANFTNLQINGRRITNLTTVEQSFKNVTDLNIDLEIGEMVIKETSGNDFSVHAGRVSDSFICEEKNGTLYIENKDQRRFRLSGLGWGSNETKIVLEVPKGTIFEETQMAVGVGEIELSGFQSKKLNIDCGMGRVNLEGRITGDSFLKCGVGEIKIKLAGTQEDYNYDVDCGIGEVRIGGDSYSGLGHSKKQNNHADNDMNIECGIGSVKVSFEN